MAEKSNSDEDTWIQLIIGVLAIFALKSIFENDRSKIVSKKGSKVLSDETKMKEINKKRLEMDGDESQKEIFI